MIDKIDLEILQLLKKNSRASWKDIGDKIFLTGQAVRARVTRLNEKGIIKRFTIDYEQENLQIILFYMTTNAFEEVENIFKNNMHILDVYSTTGDSCYILKSNFQTTDDLEIFLHSLHSYGRYKINTVLKNIK